MTVAIYAASGVRLDCRGKSLTIEKLHAYQHRSVVRLEPGAEVARVWLLDEDASIATMKRGIVFDTLDYVLGGVAVLLLSHRPELVRWVRREMLEAIAFVHPSVTPAARAKVERETAA